jgi:transporter family-2 protein
MVCGGRGRDRQPPALLLYDFFNVADLLLNFTGDLFILPFGFEMRFLEGVTDGLLHCAFRFMQGAFGFIFRAVFHGVSFVATRQLPTHKQVSGRRKLPAYVLRNARAALKRGVNLLSYFFAVAAGSANPVQAGASAPLNKGLGSPIWSALFVYASGLAGVLLVQLVLRQAWPKQFGGNNLPWWVWTGGILSIASTLTGLTLAQKMGSGVFTGLSLTASLLTSMVLVIFDGGGNEHVGIEVGFHKPACLRIRSSRSSRLACTMSKPGGTLPV